MLTNTVIYTNCSAFRSNYNAVKSQWSMSLAVCQTSYFIWLQYVTQLISVEHWYHGCLLIALKIRSVIPLTLSSEWTNLVLTNHAVSQWWRGDVFKKSVNSVTVNSAQQVHESLGITETLLYCWSNNTVLYTYWLRNVGKWIIWRLAFQPSFSLSHWCFFLSFLKISSWLGVHFQDTWLY